MNLHIDIETFSGTDIKLGVEKYISSPEFQILLFSYKYKDTSKDFEAETICIDLASGETIPAQVYIDLADASITKKAFNAGFECACINRFLQRYYPVEEYTPIEQWKCTALHSRYLNLPHKLDDVASLWNMAKQKDGKALIRYFCVPCKPTKTNGGRLRNLPQHDREKWERFKSYNILDVDIESYLDSRFEKYPVPQSEWENYWLDYRINKQGIKVDLELVKSAILVDDKYKATMVKKAQSLGVDNPNSVAQLKTVINLLALELPTNEFTFHVADLTAETVRNSLDRLEAYENNLELSGYRTTIDKIKTLLETRQTLAGTAVKKYKKMIDTELEGVIYDTIYHYGAGTGRSSGRGIQPQNFARPSLKEEAIETARNLLATCEADPASLKSLLRSMLIPCSPDHRFVISDFSAIEARVTAWLSNEKWRLEAFNQGKDIYVASYAKMFNVTEESVTKEQRQNVGKVAELALGFGGGQGAIANFAKDMPPQEAEKLKTTWRQANKSIVGFWYACGDAFHNALENPYCSYTVAEGKLLYFQGNVDTTNKVVFYYDKTFLTITLPHGRKLYYFRPGIKGNELYYLQWATTGLVEVKIYGGKLCENLSQAIARDLLFEKMQQVTTRFSEFDDPSICLHVHDEIVLDGIHKDEAEAIAKVLTEIMSTESEYCKGLPLNCSTGIARYYKK